MKRSFLSLIAASAFFAGPASAMFIRPQIEQVPIARLLSNLQQRLATNSQDVATLYQLARVHSMAYATNLAVIPVAKHDGDLVFYSYGSDSGVPQKVFPAAAPPARHEALQHLTNAIVYYRLAVKALMKGTNNTAHHWLIVPIHLGLAWCIDQSGDRSKAIEAYRETLALAWRQEVDGEFTLKDRAAWSWDRLRAGQNPFGRPQVGHIGPGVCYSDEIIGYLLNLLDPKKDAKEIAQLEADRKSLRTMPRAVTPILIPLQPGSAWEDLVDARGRVAFDLDGTGQRRSWGWIRTNAAWLVFDRDGGGRITSGLQMFGNVTFWVFWRDGYQALASLDNNADGKLTGTELNGLALWNDRNSDGVSDRGEVTPVSECGIVGIDCANDLHSSGIRFNERGATFRDGSSRATYDWIAPAH